MKKGFTTPFSNFFPRRFFCLFALFNGLKRVECSTRFFRVPLSGGAGSALFRKEAPQARIPGRVVFPPGLAVRPVRLSGGHRAHHAGCPYLYQSAEDYIGMKGVDWQEETFNPTWSQDHNLSISGGSDNTKYTASFSRYIENGIFKNSGFDKTTGKIRFNQKQIRNAKQITP